MSVGMCDRLAKESQKTDLTKLTAAESEALLKRLLLGAMGDNFLAFSALLEHSGTTSPADLGRAIGEQAVVEMVQRCPSAGPLLAKAGSAHMGAQIEITAAERPTLLAITQAACKRLDGENAKQPFSKLTSAQRSDLIKQTLSGTFLSNADELTAQYGEGIMGDKTRGEEIGKKIAMLMLEVCPTYIMQVGQDELARKRLPTAKPTAPAKPKTPPAKKASIKTAPAKVK
jgi:hypothetical protein